MPVKVSSRLDVKLFFVVTVVIILSIIPLVYTFWKAIGIYGEKVSGIHEQQIRNQVFSALKDITGVKVTEYQSFFDRISVSAGLFGSEASTIYSNLEYYAEEPLYRNSYRLLPQGIWVNSQEKPVVSLYWGDAELSEQVRTELEALTHMTPLFMRALEDNPEILASHMISVTGIGIYGTKNPNSKQSVYKLPSPAEFDLRAGEPMTIFSENTDGFKGVRWTRAYKDDVIDGLMLTASAPIYDESGKFRGIAGIDVPLETVIDDVLNIDKGNPQRLIHFAFLLDGSGKLIAYPEDYLLLLGLHSKTESFSNSADKLELSLADSSDEKVRSFAQEIIDRKEVFASLDLDSGSYYIVTDKMNKLGWIYGAVVDQQVVFDIFTRNRTGVRKMVSDLGKKGVVIAFTVTLVSLALVFSVVKYLVMPLRTLAVATKRVAAGDMSVRCPVTTEDEAGVLASSFNAMVERLQLMQERQKEYADSLEVEVDRRNKELIDKRGELEMTIELLKKEIERRQIISEALKNSQQQYYETMEATRAGIFIITDGILNYVNTPLAEMMGATSGELIGADPMVYIAEEDRDKVQENMMKRLRGEEVLPYRIKIVRMDGSSFFGELWAKVTSWQKKTALVGTVNDISNVKLNEEKLQVQEEQLRQSLAEKEILLKEIYHRTKNNMLVIISMLELQTCDIEDERVKQIFQETESRIRSMALVHEKLYGSKNLSEIDLGSYIEEVVGTMVLNRGDDSQIDMQVEVQPLPMNIDYAIPLGLVINEIVTNSVKHAFPEDRHGLVFVKLVKDEEGRIVLSIGDDGVGLPDDVELSGGGSFGMQLIYSLIKMQLKGSVTISRENGTSFEIVFQEPKSKERI